MSSENAPLSEKRQERYFEMAKNISNLSDCKQHKLGCVFIYKGKVIAAQYNTTKTSPVQKQYNKLRNFEYDTPNNGAIHAEFGCLLHTKDMEIDWNKVSVFIYRNHRNGIRARSFCCEACRQAIIDRGIRRIYFTGENSYCYERIG